MLTEEMAFTWMDSPIGRMIIRASNQGIHHIEFSSTRYGRDFYEPSHPVLQEAVKQLSEYFSRQRKVFDLPLVFTGTAFQKASWQVLLSIPYGQTISYKEQAVLMGDARKARAVAQANARNPLPIVVPCHRVVCSDGELGGYSGGGVLVKGYLLKLEGFCN